MKQNPRSAETSPPLARWLDAVGAEEAFTALAGLLPGAAVVVTDAEGHVRLWTGEAERLLGWDRAAVLGAPCPAGLACDARRRPHPYGATLRLTRQDGTALSARYFGRQFTTPEGAPLGAVHALLPTAEEEPGLDLPLDAVRFYGLISRDPAMLRVFETIRNVAETEATVLVRGESGTGKELVARAIHTLSHRREGPFIAVNCAAFTPTLLESELFGHVKGAFTGADRAREGIFAQADRGTLFLDEVAELPLELQSKLLRVLQERSFVPVGGSQPRTVDVRVVAATHRALRQEVRAGRFREDLLYRLRVVPIFLPPLRERRLDVELLLKSFLAEYNARGPRQVLRVRPDAMRALLDHPWPGNVRELRNVVEYSFAVGRGPELALDELPPEFREARAPEASPAPPLDERERLREALQSAGGDLGEAAQRLGVSRTTLWRWRRRYGV